MKIIRVFPRRTKATPVDVCARVGSPQLWDEADEVRISVTFDWDKPEAERLAEEWRVVTHRIIVGGPAYGDAGGDFRAGEYLRDGYTITSRGCPNRCWFCDAWRREGTIRELPIIPGRIVQDNNLLACSREHFVKVVAMLIRQEDHVILSGGLEAARLTEWHIGQLLLIPKLSRLWLAYDQPHEWDSLVSAARRLRESRLISPARKTGCYVLCGWRHHSGGDTIASAESRLESVARLGIWPMAMLFNGGMEWPEQERREWKDFARQWSNPTIIGSKIRSLVPNP